MTKEEINRHLTAYFALEIDELMHPNEKDFRKKHLKMRTLGALVSGVIRRTGGSFKDVLNSFGYPVRARNINHLSRCFEFYRDNPDPYLLAFEDGIVGIMSGGREIIEKIQKPT